VLGCQQAKPSEQRSACLAAGACSLFGYSYTGVKAKKYADKIVKREMAQGKDEHSLPSIAAAMVLKLRTAKKARFTIRQVFAWGLFAAMGYMGSNRVFCVLHGL
jgi:hypothetical protein